MLIRTQKRPSLKPFKHRATARIQKNVLKISYVSHIDFLFLPLHFIRGRFKPRCFTAQKYINLTIQPNSGEIIPRSIHRNEPRAIHRRKSAPGHRAKPRPLIHCRFMRAYVQKLSSPKFLCHTLRNEAGPLIHQGYEPLHYPINLITPQARNRKISQNLRQLRSAQCFYLHKILSNGKLCVILSRKKANSKNN